MSRSRSSRPSGSGSVAKSRLYERVMRLKPVQIHRNGLNSWILEQMLLKAQVGIEPRNKGFADPTLPPCSSILSSDYRCLGYTGPR